jgi:hypothetical protein
MFSNLLTDVIATSIVAVTVPALAVPISFGWGPGKPACNFVNQMAKLFYNESPRFKQEYVFTCI